MPLEISYHAHAPNKNMLGRELNKAETLAISVASALAGATPAEADVVRIHATEAARVGYTGAASTASAASVYLPAGATIELPAAAGWKVAGKTA